MATRQFLEWLTTKTLQVIHGVMCDEYYNQPRNAARLKVRKQTIYAILDIDDILKTRRKVQDVTNG